MPPTASPSPTEAPREADWTLHVEDTIEKSVQGITVSYTFILDAVKHGGTTDLGSYTGTASLKQKMDAGELSNPFMAMSGGVDTSISSDNVQIDIVAYDREKYDSFGLKDDEPPLSNLSELDGMALGSLSMSGSGSFDVSVDAAQNIHGQVKANESGTGAISYKLNVEGGQVSVSIPELGLPDSFKGMVTGVPIN